MIQNIIERKIIKGKNFLLCVSGGIAVYKTLELVRFLKKMGGNVKVVMSASAQRFVAPLSFEALSENPVLSEESEDWGRGISHIAYASWADVCILAPATINSLSKLAYGMSDNVMLSTLLASKSPILIAPAANTQMYLSAQAQESIQKLVSMGHEIIQPKEGLLACGIYGVGALAEIEEIGYQAIRKAWGDSFWRGKKVIVSGGGSSEEIDEVRCITNHSSGLQAGCLALALYLMGAEVVFVSSRFPIFLPSGIECRVVQNTKEFYGAIEANLEGAEYYFGVAALSDFVPKQKRGGKIKKQEGLQVEFVENIDVLKSLKGVKKIGFKAEKDREKARFYAQRMLEEKECEFVCLNIIGGENPFGGIQNAFSLIGREGELEFGLNDKFSLAFALLDGITKLSHKD